MTSIDHDVDYGFMRKAIEAARAAAHTGVPIAALLVRDGIILATECNSVAATYDPTAHAEIQAIRSACRRLGETDLGGATLYSTLEPCGMCTMASIWSKIGRVVFGAGRSDVHEMYFEDRHLHLPDFLGDAFRAVRVTGGVLRDECAALYYGPHDHPPKNEQGNK